MLHFFGRVDFGEKNKKDFDREIISSDHDEEYHRFNDQLFYNVSTVVIAWTFIVILFGSCTPPVGDPEGSCGEVAAVDCNVELTGLVLCSSMWSTWLSRSTADWSRLWYGTKIRTASTGKRPVGEYGGVAVWVPIAEPVGSWVSSGDDAVVLVWTVVEVAISVWAMAVVLAESPGKDTLS